MRRLGSLLPCAVLIGVVASTQAIAIEFDNVVSLGDSLLDDGTGGLRSPVLSENIATRIGAPHTKLAIAGA